MTADSKGRDLFIVDNSVSGWTGLRYLEEWSGIAKAFDIATGYFEIGALLALDNKWQPLVKIRILMGAETTHRTRKALLEAVRSRAVEILDGSIEAATEGNPFLHGVPAPRRCTTEEKTLVDLRARVEKHIKNTYLKRVDAPVGVKPALKCWMELNE